MPEAKGTVGQSMGARMLHGALVSGVVIFGAVTALVFRPARADASLPPMMLYAFVGASLAATALGLGFLRGRVPRRVQEQSPDLYWQGALTPALVTWSALEGGALIALAAYFVGGSPLAVTAAVIALAALIALHPGRLDRI